jgi:hypothetical protein
MRVEDAGDGLGRTEEEGRAPQAKASKAGGKAPGLDRPEKTAADATSDASVMADVGPAQTEGATVAEVVASRPATDEVAAGDIAGAGASLGPARSGDLREATGEVTMEVPASVKASEPPAVVAQDASILELTPSAAADARAPEMATGTAAGALFFRATSDTEKVSREAHDVQMVESERGEASSPPQAITQGAPGGKDPAAPAGSSVSSQSSAGQLQKEWADTASSAGFGKGLKAQGNHLTLAELSRQLTTVRTSLGNMNLQFLEAEQTIDVSNMSLSFDFLCRLRHRAGWAICRLGVEPVTL